MLRIQDLHAFYGSSHAVQGVSLGIEAGTVVAMLGRNGVGKTTTLRSIVGLVPQREGTIALDGRDLTHLNTDAIVRAGIAYVPEERRVFQSLSTLENLRVAHVRENGKWPIERILELFPSLRRLAGVRSRNLSGGEQQMLAIGRALATGPRILLLDEPFQGLAPEVAHGLLGAISSIRSDGIGVLLVEQNYELVMKLADHHYVMDAGRIVHAGDRETTKEDIIYRHLGVG